VLKVPLNSNQSVPTCGLLWSLAPDLAVSDIGRRRWHIMSRGDLTLIGFWLHWCAELYDEVANFWNIMVLF